MDCAESQKVPKKWYRVVHTHRENQSTWRTVDGNGKEIGILRQWWCGYNNSAGKARAWGGWNQTCTGKARAMQHWHHHRGEEIKVKWIGKDVC
jgi:hypothetical protein